MGSLAGDLEKKVWNKEWIAKGRIPNSDMALSKLRRARLRKHRGSAVAYANPFDLISAWDHQRAWWNVGLEQR